MIENRPYFSVILTTYNRSTLLKRAIESVIKQEFEDWELVIVNAFLSLISSTVDSTRYIC